MRSVNGTEWKRLAKKAAKRNISKQVKERKMNLKIVYRETMTESMQIRMPRTLFQKLTRVAKEKKIPRQELIRQILQQIMDEVPDLANEKEIA